MGDKRYKIDLGLLIFIKNLPTKALTVTEKIWSAKFHVPRRKYHDEQMSPMRFD